MEGIVKPPAGDTRFSNVSILVGRCEFRVAGLGSGVRDLGCEVGCVGFGVWRLRFGDWDLGFGVHDGWFGVWVLGFRVWDWGVRSRRRCRGFGFRVSGSEFRVSELGCGPAKSPSSSKPTPMSYSHT